VEAKAEVDPRALAALKTMRLDPRFRTYSPDDLATSQLTLTARKPWSAPAFAVSRGDRMFR